MSSVQLSGETWDRALATDGHKRMVAREGGRQGSQISLIKFNFVAPQKFAQLQFIAE